MPRRPLFNRDRSFWVTVIATLLAVWFCLVPGFVSAQSPTSNSKAKNETPVLLQGQPVFYLRDRALSSSVEQRAARISNRIREVAEESAIPVEDIKASDFGNTTIIHAEDIAIATITESDAKTANQSRKVLAEQYLQSIKSAITQYREERSARYLTRATIIAVVSTIALIVVLVVLGNIMPRFYRWLDAEQERWIPRVQIRNFDLLTSQQISALLQFITGIIHFATVLGLLYFYISQVLSLFPTTRAIGKSLIEYLRAALSIVWNGFLSYLPNLLTIGLITILTFYFLRFLKFIFVSIRRGALSIPGFYPEWADPTYRLLMFSTIALAAAVAFPYLPGSSSPAFQGISIFLGVLVSFGSSGAISNIVAGFILVYTRAFRLGDRIQVGEVMGFVEEKSLLVTRIRTLNNNVVSIPNSSLLSSNITNFSALLRDSKSPLVVHTNVSLGYDVPWRTIYETLIAAALATPDILPEPKPFVFQKELNDFYVSYQLRAFTNNPVELERIASELHQNIQDKCNEAGIEICSPHYSTLRDGNQSTIPANYLPKDYTAPGFRISSLSLAIDQESANADSNGDSSATTADLPNSNQEPQTKA